MQSTPLMVVMGIAPGRVQVAHGGAGVHAPVDRRSTSVNTTLALTATRRPGRLSSGVATVVRQPVIRPPIRHSRRLKRGNRPPSLRTTARRVYSARYRSAKTQGIIDGQGARRGRPWCQAGVRVQVRGDVALERRHRRLYRGEDLGRGVEPKLLDASGERPESCDDRGASCLHGRKRGLIRLTCVGVSASGERAARLRSEYGVGSERKQLSACGRQSPRSAQTPSARRSFGNKAGNSSGF